MPSPTIVWTPTKDALTAAQTAYDASLVTAGLPPDAVDIKLGSALSVLHATGTAYDTLSARLRARIDADDAAYATGVLAWATTTVGSTAPASVIYATADAADRKSVV